MTRLVRAEWTKLFTTRVWLGLVLGSCLLVGGLTALLTGLAGVSDNGRQGLPPVQDPEFQHTVLAVSSNATVLMLILGIIGTTQEFRHRTATPTFLTTPRRGRVVVAKLVAYALVAILFAVAVLAVNQLVLQTYARARGAAPSLTGQNLDIVLGTGAALVLYTVIGVGLGALLRNQVGAIVGSLVWLFVVENIIGGISATASAYKWLPGGALRALTSGGHAVVGPNSGGPEILAPWQGGLLLLGYGLVAAVVGTLLTVRRDVV